MKTRLWITSAILWAATIIAAAIVRAPWFFVLGLLPLLAITSLIAVNVIVRLSPKVAA